MQFDDYGNRYLRLHRRTPAKGLFHFHYVERINEMYGVDCRCYRASPVEYMLVTLAKEIQDFASQPVRRCRADQMNIRVLVTGADVVSEHADTMTLSQEFKAQQMRVIDDSISGFTVGPTRSKETNMHKLLLTVWQLPTLLFWTTLLLMQKIIDFFRTFA